MRAECPHCESAVQVNERLAGKEFICPSCKAVFIVPPPVVNPICPECGWLMERGEVLCVKCGYNIETGERLETAMGPPEDGRPAAIRWLEAFAGFVPGLFRPATLLLFGVCLGISLFLLYIMLFVIGFSMFLTSIAIGAMAFSVYAQGVALLFTGGIMPLKAAMVELEGDRWWAFLAVVFAPAAGIMGLMALAAKVMAE